ncbi:tautomerase family protein [Pseudomonas izuensis]|uniref:tautomerase family protein n=1 Tax=Pseudomonas izuensis TaxID=2684212 RepID=UPI00135A106C|nr:tautomerase family protein [Pseudomonas izuensis]
MPLWKVYHPEEAFSSEDKQAISQRITSLYHMLPPFYVGVVFEAIPKSSFYIGGEPADDFVRISVDHIARQFNDEEIKQRFLNAVAKLLAPFITERGLRWEMHVDETPFSLWTIGGYRPPLPGTPDEIRWRSENRPSPLQA